MRRFTQPREFCDTSAGASGERLLKQFDSPARRRPETKAIPAAFRRQRAPQFAGALGRPIERGGMTAGDGHEEDRRRMRDGKTHNREQGTGKREQWSEGAVVSVDPAFGQRSPEFHDAGVGGPRSADVHSSQVRKSAELVQTPTPCSASSLQCCVASLPADPAVRSKAKRPVLRTDGPQFLSRKPSRSRMVSR